MLLEPVRPTPDQLKTVQYELWRALTGRKCLENVRSISFLRRNSISSVFLWCVLSQGPLHWKKWLLTPVWIFHWLTVSQVSGVRMLCQRERQVIWSLPKSVILDFDQTRSRRFHRQGQVWEPDTVCTCVHACVSVLKPWQPFCKCPTPHKTSYQLPSNQTEWPFRTPSNNWKHLSNHLKCPSNHSPSTYQSKFGQLFPCSCWVLCFMVWGECEGHLLNCMTSATVPPQSGMVKYGCRWPSVMNPLSH